MTGCVFLVGGLGLAGLPVLGLWWGKAMLEHSLSEAGAGWAVAAVVCSGVLTSGAVLRVTARVFLGLGEDPRELSEDPEAERSEVEPGQAGGRATALTHGPAWMLLASGVALAVVPWVHQAGATAGAVFADQNGYVDAVRHPGVPQVPLTGPAETVWTGTGLALAGVTLGLGILLAAAALWGPRLRLHGWMRTGVRCAHAAMDGLHALHAADLPEQIGWLMAGAAVLAAVVH